MEAARAVSFFRSRRVHRGSSHRGVVAFLAGQASVSILLHVLFVCLLPISAVAGKIPESVIESAARAWMASWMNLVLAEAVAPSASTDTTFSREAQIGGRDSVASSDRQGSMPLGALQQTAAIPSASSADRFSSSNRIQMRSGESDIRVGNSFEMSALIGKGLNYTGSASADTRHFRTQKISDISANVANRITKEENNLYSFQMDIGQSYRKKKTLGLGRFGKEVIFDNQAASATAELLAPVLGARSSNITVQAEANRGTNDFKYDRIAAGALSGSLNYNLWNRITASGGVGVRRKVQSSEVGNLNFSSLPSESDTIRASLSFGQLGGMKLLELSYSKSKGVEREVMPPLGNSLEVLDDPSKAQREEANIDKENITVAAKSKPTSTVSFNMKFDRKIDSQQYKADERRSGKREDTAIEGVVDYRYARRGVAKITVKTSENVNDMGAKNLSSYSERNYSVSMGISQVIGDSLSLSANGVGQLKQRFYKLREVNPRDADYLVYSGDANISKKLLPRLWVNVAGAIGRYETINIDAGLSGDNRIDYQYRLAPSIRMKPTSWLNLTQDYTIKIEFTDFVFTEDKNYLNRTTTLNTQAEMKPARSMSLSVKHGYLMKDSGSYLKREDRELYSPNNRNVEHLLAFDLADSLFAGWLIKTRAEFRTQENGFYGVRDGVRKIVRTTRYESGGLQVGFQHKKKIARLGTIDLDVAYCRNYGAAITEARKRFWMVNSSIDLKF